MRSSCSSVSILGWFFSGIDGKTLLMGLSATTSVAVAEQRDGEEMKLSERF
ncbi:hypothetical protein Fmac_010227 [Flemingia macrophylla]|uniref:Uncharacterized protein n=1 Tax=Flemingia macrophylla TaxID=520843 RepID=A0ABD1N3C2_9FABA